MNVIVDTDKHHKYIAECNKIFSEMVVDIIKMEEDEIEDWAKTAPKKISEIIVNDFILNLDVPYYTSLYIYTSCVVSQTDIMPEIIEIVLNDLYLHKQNLLKNLCEMVGHPSTQDDFNSVISRKLLRINTIFDIMRVDA